MFPRSAIVKPHPSGGGTVPVTANLVAQWIGDNYTAGNWPDSSGNGNTATQSDATKQPSFVASVLNGHAGVRFGDQTTLMGLTTSVVALNPFSIFLVQTNGSTPFFTRTIRSLENNSLISPQRGSNGYFNQGDFANNTNTGPCVVSVVVGAQSNAWVNGAPITTDTSKISDWGTILIGSGTAGGPGNNEPAACDVLEILIYSAALNSTDRSAVEGYLNTKYGPLL